MKRAALSSLAVLALAGCADDGLVSSAQRGDLAPAPGGPSAALSAGVLQVAIDLRPDPIDLAGTTTLTVYLFTTPAFDATQVQPASVKLVVGGQGSGAPVSSRSGVYSSATRDYDGDGDTDRMVVFRMSDVKAAGLRGCNPLLTVQDLTSGYQFVGTDATQPAIVNGVAVASVVVTPSPTTLDVGDTQQFTAAAYDAGNVLIPGCRATWDTSDHAVATSDAGGLVSAHAEGGPIQVSATVEGVTGSAELTVAGDQVQAVDDAYTATANIAISVNGVLDNDTGSGLTVTKVQGSASNVGVFTNTTATGLGGVSGRIRLNADGSFVYDPPPGYTGSDQVTYEAASHGGGAAAAATVLFAVGDVGGRMMWFVCDGCGGNNRGTLLDPFTSTGGFAAANTGAAPAPQPGHLVYVRSGTYDASNDNLGLRNGQGMYGQGIAASSVFAPDANSHPSFAALTAGTRPTIAPPVGPAITLANGNTLSHLNVGGSIGIIGNGFGALTVSNVTVNTSGMALSLVNGSASGAGVSFVSVSSTGGPSNVGLANLSGSNLFDLGSGALSGASGNAFDVDNGTAPISYGGTITNTTARPVRVENYDGGTISFSGTISGLAQGILLNNNSGTAIDFSDRLNLNTGTTTAFTATGGGTVRATGSHSVLSTTTATALRVENTTIGTGGLTFERISSNGAPSGIVLNNTGSSGGLTITGAGTSASGGVILNSTGDGISLTATSNASLSRMVIEANAGSGIFGSSVTNFSLTGSTVRNNGNAVGEAGLEFQGLFGTASISNTTVTGSAEDHLVVRNSSGTLSALNVNGSTFSGNSAAVGSDGILIAASGSASATVSVASNTFSANRGDHFQATASNSAVLNVTFFGNTLQGGHPSALGQGITLGTGLSFTGTLRYDLNGNHIVNGPISNAITIVQSGEAGSVLRGRVRGNTIGTSGVNLSCSSQASGISLEAYRSGTHTVSVTNNTLRRCYDRGIQVLAQDGNGIMNLTASNNTVSELTTANSREGLYINAGAFDPNVLGGTDSHLVCAAITGNSLTQGPSGSAHVRLRQRFNTAVRLPGYAGGATDMAAVQAFVSGNNSGSPVVATAASNGYVGGSACPTE